MVMSLSRVLWKVRSKAPTVTASVQGTVSVTGEGYTTIRDSTHTERVAVLREGFQSEQRIGRPTVAPGALGPAVE